MKIWQKAMVFLALNHRVTKFMQRWSSLSALSRQFIGGSNIIEAINSCDQLKQEGILTSMFYLGEYVEDKGVIKHTVEQKKEITKSVAKNNIDIHISVDPTQIGYLASPELLEENATSIADVISAASKENDNNGFNTLMLDMEDYSLIDTTISLYKKLIRKDLLVAITLQAYLYRTENDLADIISEGGKVRLVKGAFAADSSIAYTKKPDIKANYMKLVGMMLSDKAKNSGFYPVFATHDDMLVEKIIKLANEKGWGNQDYEFEMLFGVRGNYQRELAKREQKVRVYLPFGQDWWPYAVRRVGENPKNAGLLIKALISKS